MDNKTIKMCRVCLQSDFNNCSSLFDVYKSLYIFEHINSFAHVSIIKDDGLPDKICGSCFSDLETCVNFRIKCESSNDILFNNLKSENDDLIIKKEELAEYSDYHYSESDELFTDLVGTELKVEKKQKDIASDQNNFPQCHDCGETFKSKCKLRVHWKKIHVPKSFVCPICRRLFKTAKSYNKHMKSTPGPCSELADNMGVHVEGEGVNRIFFCSQCDYKTKKMLHMRTHLVTHSGQRLFQCDICNKTYTQRGSLKNHREGVHFKELSSVGCHICGKTFNGRTRLYKHIRTHSDENFECDICYKSIKGKKSLQNHMLRHSGVKSYTCERCAASFFTMAELCNHRKKHLLKARSVKCELCDYKTTTKHLVNKHMKRHTSAEKPFPCKECGKFFATFQKLTFHQRIHYESKNYSCPLCSKMFYCKRSVSKHVISKHNSKMLQNRGTIMAVKQEVQALTE